MTPDELRRMDNDLCIIFEKGIKPVKANKFYYFKHKNMATSLRKAEISHNDIGEIQRGNWRKFNPYNPWTEDKSEKEVQNLKVDSLDDLFDEEPKKEENKETVKVEATNKEISTSSELQSIDDLFGDISVEEDVSLTGFEASKDEEIKSAQEDVYDLQKELEAKFDELFGPLDD